MVVIREEDMMIIPEIKDETLDYTEIFDLGKFPNFCQPAEILISEKKIAW